MAAIRPIPAPSATPSNDRGVFAEDREILEAQQASILANPELRLQAYRIDEGGTRARALIARTIRRNDQSGGTRASGDTP